jgi:hypothetical protein
LNKNILLTNTLYNNYPPCYIINKFLKPAFEFKIIIIIQTNKELNIGKRGESTWKLVDHVIIFDVGRWHNEGRMNVAVSVEHRRRNDFVELVVVEGAVDGVAQVDFAGH